MPPSMRRNPNVAVHLAARTRRRGGDIARLNTMMRSRRAVVFSVSRAAPPKMTSIGLEVTTTFTINQAELGDGIHQYELLDGEGNVLWSGLGDDPVEALLQIIIRMTEGEDPDRPNN